LVKYLFKNCSTSPEQEPDDFVASLRSAFRIGLQHPHPMKTYFKNGRSNIYQKLEGVLEWTKIE
jgi:hypothetical protein